MTSALNWLSASAEAVGEAVNAAASRPHSEAQLTLPDFKQVHFLGITGWNILAIGLAVCAIGLLMYQKLKNLPVHKAMLEISELIYGTCKTYLKTQAKFIALLWLPIATIIVVYFAVLEKVPLPKVLAIAGFSVVGI